MRPDLTAVAAAWLSDCEAGGGSSAACREGLPRILELAVVGKERWQAVGRPAGVLVDGWFVDDDLLDPGGLQFDTGECGDALVTLYAITGETDYLDAARRAGTWAAAEVPVGNWNYNAFSVDLLARLAAIDPAAGPVGTPVAEPIAEPPVGTPVVEPPVGTPVVEPVGVSSANQWAQEALTHARVGVMPGALPDGRWLDPHNARIVYHVIMLAALAHLDEVVDDPWLTATITAANRRSVDELRTLGATAYDDGIDAHLATRRLGYAQDSAIERLVNGALVNGRPNSLALAWWIADELDTF